MLIRLGGHVKEFRFDLTVKWFILTFGLFSVKQEKRKGQIQEEQKEQEQMVCTSPANWSRTGHALILHVTLTQDMI